MIVSFIIMLLTASQQKWIIYPALRNFQPMLMLLRFNISNYQRPVCNPLSFYNLLNNYKFLLEYYFYFQI